MIVVLLEEVNAHVDERGAVGDFGRGPCVVSFCNELSFQLDRVDDTTLFQYQSHNHCNMKGDWPLRPPPYVLSVQEIASQVIDRPSRF